MATRISDIAQANAYTGNANLGGGSFGVVDLNTRPVDALAHYTFLYGQREHDERQKQIDEDVKKVAALAQFNPDLSIPKDREEAYAAYNELQKIGREYAQEDIPHDQRAKRELDFQAKVAEHIRKIQGANGRALSYQARKKEINEDTRLNPAQKERMLRELDDEANRTKITDPISALPKFDYTVPTVGKAPVSEIDVAMIGGDDNAVATYTLVNPRQLFAAASAQAMDMMDAVVDPNSPEYQRLSPTAKLHQDMLRSGAGKQWGIWQQASNFFNDALSSPRYRTQDGKIDENAIKTANPMVGNILSLVDRYNEWANRKKQEAQQGVYTDNLGRQFRTASPINPDDFVTIDKSKGLTADQLLAVQMWANADAEKKEVKLTHTGEASQNRRASQQEAGANYRARLSASKGNTPTGATDDGDAYTGNIIDQANQDVLYYYDNGKKLRLVDPKGRNVKMVNGRLIDADGNPYNVAENLTFELNASSLGDAVVTEFNRNAKLTADEAGISSTIVPTEGKVMVKVSGNAIEGVQTSTGTIADRNYFKHITRNAALKVPTGKEAPTELGKTTPKKKVTPTAAGAKKPETPAERARRIAKEIKG